MRLYLVRHGVAKSKAEDAERSLNERGISETKRVAAFLKPLAIKVDVIYHSGKARASGTAGIIADAVESVRGVIQRDGIAPEDDVKKFAKEASKLDKDIMVVGHLPFLGKLVSYLLTGDGEANVVNFAPSGVVCLERDRDRWLLNWMVIPDF